ERHLVPEHRGDADQCAITPGVGPAEAIETRPLAIEPRRVERPRRRGWDDWPVSYALNFALQNAWRGLLGHETTTAVGRTMNRSGLFTSRFDRGLLVYRQ